MVKVFISVGMSGRNDRDVVDDLFRAKDKIEEIYGEGTVRLLHNFDCVPPDDVFVSGRLYYLGEAIKKLGNCDICYFTKGWQNYRGCRAEYEICKIYGIEIIEEV